MRDKINKLVKQDLLYILIFLIFFTSSFDIFLTIEILGFTIRISQVLCIILFIYCFIKFIKNPHIQKSVGWKQLIMWSILLLLFTFNTISPIMNIGYHLWLIFNIMIIVCFTQIIKKNNSEKILKLYIMSFTLMAIVGIIQCIMGAIGFEAIYIKQWWIKGVLPRINAFSFEPSYYATYMIIGWVMNRILLNEKENSKKLNLKILINLVLITASIILSSSRIGIALIIAIEGIIFIKNTYNIFIKKENSKRKEFIVELILIIISVLILSILLSNSNFNFLFNGLGIKGTSSHSISEREKNLSNVLEVFRDSPIIGRGLGGIYAEMTNNKGIDVKSVNPQEVTPGICIFAEVLAASGIFGFAFFIWYILYIIIIPLKLSNALENKRKIILRALVTSLIAELIILQFNQNILRIYLWLHIAMLTTYFNIYKGENKNESSDRC